MICAFHKVPAPNRAPCKSGIGSADVKMARLSRFFGQGGPFALAFSGGVDSAFLLYAGVKAGADIRPYFVKTAFQRAAELTHARGVAKAFGAKLHVIKADILSFGPVAANPPDRCYHCKTFMLSKIMAAAKKDGAILFMDGTNGSDCREDRPGMRALAELSVFSPLREAGFGKAEIREILKAEGIWFWDRPSNSCLATRGACAQPITKRQLKNVEKAERALHRMGFSNLRVKHAKGAATLYFTKDQISKANDCKDAVINRVGRFFTNVGEDFQIRESGD